MQKLRGYLALGTFIMGIASFLCLLLPLIEITDDALMLMMLAVPPLICGLFIALALHMLLYTLLLVLYGCRIQLVDLYFLHILSNPFLSKNPCRSVTVVTVFLVPPPLSKSSTRPTHTVTQNSIFYK